MKRITLTLTLAALVAGFGAQAADAKPRAGSIGAAGFRMGAVESDRCHARGVVEGAIGSDRRHARGVLPAAGRRGSIAPTRFRLAGSRYNG